MEVAAPPRATDEQLARIHGEAYVREILALQGRKVRLDPDTATSAGSVDAAVLAAAGAAAQARQVTKITLGARSGGELILSSCFLGVSP